MCSIWLFSSSTVTWLRSYSRKNRVSLALWCCRLKHLLWSDKLPAKKSVHRTFVKQTIYDRFRCTRCIQILILIRGRNSVYGIAGDFIRTPKFFKDSKMYEHVSEGGFEFFRKFFHKAFTYNALDFSQRITFSTNR